MNYDNILTSSQLDALCGRLALSKRIAFDTEFVSEFNYRPNLCLIQIEYDGQLAIIDPHAVGDVKPFWDVLVKGNHQTIVHAGREEFRFCMQATGQAPKQWFDVQLAAGMIGLEYPISYGKLLQKLTGTSLSKQETRTDWRRRPLTAGQLDYALQDVVYLPAIFDHLVDELNRLKRTEWMATEVEDWKASVLESESRENWRRIAGASNLPRKRMPIVRELWRWREMEAERRDCPPRRVLRDDLIVELARRGQADEKSIRAIRGLHRRDLEMHYGDVAAAIRAGVDSPPDSRPRDVRRDYPGQINLLGQFLVTALSSICRRQSIAASLVGTVQDVRDLIAHHLGYLDDSQTPALRVGWRAEIVGQTIERLLMGELSLRIEDPHSDAPLVFEETK